MTSYQLPNSQIDLTNKRQILNYLYTSIDMKRYKYTIIDKFEDLEVLKKDQYFVSHNFCGVNCFLVFVKIYDTYHSVLIDRKTVLYNMNDSVIEKANVFPIKIRLGDDIYLGSIFDGIYVESQKHFIITDVLHLFGRSLTEDNLQYKLINVKAFLDATMKSDNILNTISLRINKLYNLAEIEKVINDPLFTTKNVTRGLVFYPAISGTKLIYINKNTERTVNILPQKYTIKTSKEITATFEIKQTSTIDVYNLYLACKITKDNKPVLVSKKIDLAYIPTISCSQLCRSIFETPNNTKKPYLVICKFLNDKQKWMPLKLDDTKHHPTLISELSNELDIFIPNK